MHRFGASQASSSGGLGHGNVDRSGKMIFAARITLSGCILLTAGFQHDSAQKKVFHVSYEVLDRTGTPVPNARLTVVAVNEKGRSYGPNAEWSTGVGTNLSGKGHMGFGTAPNPRPGHLRLVARHPSIGEVRKTVEWSAVMYDVRPQSFGAPVFALKADRGFGLESWRRAAAKKAPEIVKSLMKTRDEKEVDSLTEQLVAGEMMSIPPLVTALQDYENPLRRRLVRAFIRAWNGCYGQGPLDVAIRPKALAIYSVNMYVGILPMKPQVEPSFLGRREKEIAREIAWAIEDLRERIPAARQKGDTYQARVDEAVLTRMKEVQRQMAKNLDADF